MFKKMKKTSSGVRHQLNIKKYLLSKNSSLSKSLSVGKKVHSGRSSLFGNITVYHKGGGKKKLFRNLNTIKDIKLGLLLCVNYDPTRNSFTSLYYDFFYKKFHSCLFTKSTYPGSLLSSYQCVPELHLGSCLQVKNVPTGSIIHSLHSFSTSKYIKSAGTYGVLIEKNLENCKVRLPSGLVKQFSVEIFCVLGSIYNNFSNSVVIGKAGRSRHKGKRPTVRGVAMNPVDHPHGGRTKGGRPSVTPWGLPTKGKPTRKKKYGKI